MKALLPDSNTSLLLPVFMPAGFDAGVSQDQLIAVDRVGDTGLRGGEYTFSRLNVLVFPPENSAGFRISGGTEGAQVAGRGVGAGCAKGDGPVTVDRLEGTGAVTWVCQYFNQFPGTGKVAGWGYGVLFTGSKQAYTQE